MSCRRAFTLVEVTVAIAVTMVLLTLMLQVLTQSSTIWNHSNESLDTFREARAALQLMAREIGQLRAAPEPQQTFPLLALEHHPDTAPEDRVNQEIYALVSTPNNGHADWCAVGYYCRWNEQRQAFSLARQFTKSDTAYLRMRQVLNAAAPLTGPAAFKALYLRPEANVSAGSATSDGAVDDVATYLWDLQFVLPKGLTFSESQQATWPQGEFSQQLPPWIEVRCKVLGSLAARRLAGTGINRATWFDQNSSLYKRLIFPHQQQFVTRISLAQ